MSDREQLAARLVSAAASAICRKGDPDCAEGLVPAMVWREAQEAAVAVLRVLATLGDNPPYPAAPAHWEYFNRGELAGLADYIEKGAGDA